MISSLEPLQQKDNGGSLTPVWQFHLNRSTIMTGQEVFDPSEMMVQVEKARLLARLKAINDRITEPLLSASPGPITLPPP